MNANTDHAFYNDALDLFYLFHLLLILECDYIVLINEDIKGAVCSRFVDNVEACPLFAENIHYKEEEEEEEMYFSSVIAALFAKDLLCGVLVK